MTSAVSVRDPGLDSPEAVQRKAYMRRLFGFQARHYDLHDDIIGLGVHRLWVRDMVAVIRGFMKDRAGARMLDLACGTGFVTFNVARTVKNIEIDAFDITPEMVAVAKERARRNGQQINFWVGDAELPYGESKYDIVATCFAFRNFANKALAVDNMMRALVPGGMLVIQDMTKPERQPWRGVYLFALGHLMPLVAAIIGTERKAPRYLYNSVMAMPPNGDILNLLLEKGFINLSCKNQTLGMGTIVVGYRPEG